MTTTKEWFNVLSFFFTAIILDQLSKFLALSEATVYFNSGVMGGFLSGFPPVLKTVVISSVGVLVVIAFLVLQLFLPKRVYGLRVGLAIFAGGMMGNIIDRVFRGSIVDFIVIQVWPLSHIALNVADVLQWVGVLLTLVMIGKCHRDLFPDRNHRTARWIKPRFQFRYIAAHMGIGLGSAVLSMVLSFTFLREALSGLPTLGGGVGSRVFIAFVVLFLVFQAIYLSGVWAISNFLSGRTAGPIFAFERFVRESIEGKNPGATLKLREKDEFNELETLAREISERIERS